MFLQFNIYIKLMILKILNKYNDKIKRKKIIITIINNLNITDNQKNLYLDSLDFLDDFWLEKLYNSLKTFISDLEQEKLEKITTENFSKIAWIRKKEAIEKEKELNSFWFLLNNL